MLSFIASLISIYHSYYVDRKLVTAILTGGTSFYSVFHVDYGDHDHVFTEPQRWYRKKLDRIILGNYAESDLGGLQDQVEKRDT